MFRRRGCYVCGQLGHLAENCSYTDRRCFNCLEAGHESSACPAPRTTETKQCYNCGGKGHIKTDCPSIDTPQCYSCGGKGHVKANCPTVDKEKKCFGCGGSGHVKANCATVKAGGGGAGGKLTCRKCGGPNHFARDCKADGPVNVKPKSCYTCNQTGHIAKHCPQAQTDVAGTAPGTNPTAALTA